MRFKLSTLLRLWLLIGLGIGALIYVGITSAYSPLNVPGPVGDVDRGGTVAATDSLHILRYVSGLEAFDQEQRDLADVNHDGQINAIDSLLIQRQVSGLEIAPIIIDGPDSDPQSVANIQATLQMLPAMVKYGAASRMPLTIWISATGTTPLGLRFGSMLAYWTSWDGNGVPANLIVLPPGQIYTTVAHEVFHAYSGHFDTFSGRSTYSGSIEDFAIEGADCYGTPGTSPSGAHTWFTSRFGSCN